MNEIQTIIQATLAAISRWSPEAADLVYETGMVESRYQRLTQISGPARSWWQIEPATAFDNCINYLAHEARRPLLYNICDVCNIPPTLITVPSINKLDWLLTTNITFAVCMCRVKYLRDHKKIPKSLKARAKYWKRVYNTPKGAGTVEKYLEANK